MVSSIAVAVARHGCDARSAGPFAHERVLMLSMGAGAEIRRAMGVTVFSGMIGVTIFGLIFTPVFYVVARRLAVRDKGAQHQPQPAE